MLLNSYNRGFGRSTMKSYEIYKKIGCTCFGGRRRLLDVVCEQQLLLASGRKEVSTVVFR